MPKLYERNQGGQTRYYADLRDIGGGQIALKPPGSRRATTDRDEAVRLLAVTVAQLALPTEIPSSPAPPFADFAAEFLQANPGQVTDKWLAETALRLRRAAEYFGRDRDLRTIRPRDLRGWLARLGHLSASNQRHHLHALSSLFRYAQELEVVPLGYNPVKGLYRKPRVVTTGQRTDEFFEIEEAAHFLDAATRLNACPALIATFLLTGGRRSEVLGLLRGDIELDTGFVRIRPNRYRSLKRIWSERAVPLWPQLREHLEPHLRGKRGSPTDLLFPSGRTGRPFGDLRKVLSRIAAAVGHEPPRLTKFRHTYATARLQTTDQGKQISLWTVAKELGHKTVARVEDTYGHPSQHRVRGESVEYRLPSG